MQSLNCGIAVASGGETCQPIGHTQLVDVSREANRDDIVGRQGELEKKHSVMDLLPEHETAVNERAIIRKCKHNQRRGFVCGQMGEPDEETLKRFVFWLHVLGSLMHVMTNNTINNAS